MILRSLICDAVVSYFKSKAWTDLVSTMARGKEVRHAHAYVDSILHPQPLIKVVEEYFKAHDLPLQRKIYLIPPMNLHGMTDIYNIHPKQDWGHCELIFRYSPDYIISPRAARSLEMWDDKYMEQYYAHFNFKTDLTAKDKHDLESYFDSDSWRLQYHFMMEGTNRHAHSLVETSIHPEIIQDYAIRAIENRNWEVSKSVSIVYNVRGHDFGKITILVKRPEVMLELEWAFNPKATIQPGAQPMVLGTTIEDLHHCMSGLDYIYIDDAAVENICERIRADAKKK